MQRHFILQKRELVELATRIDRNTNATMKLKKVDLVFAVIGTIKRNASMSLLDRAPPEIVPYLKPALDIMLKTPSYTPTPGPSTSQAAAAPAPSTSAATSAPAATSASGPAQATKSPQQANQQHHAQQQQQQQKSKKLKKQGSRTGSESSDQPPTKRAHCTPSPKQNQQQSKKLPKPKSPTKVRHSKPMPVRTTYGKPMHDGSFTKPYSPDTADGSRKPLFGQQAQQQQQSQQQQQQQRRASDLALEATAMTKNPTTAYEDASQRYADRVTTLMMNQAMDESKNVHEQDEAERTQKQRTENAARNPFTNPHFASSKLLPPCKGVSHVTTLATTQCDDRKVLIELLQLEVRFNKWYRGPAMAFFQTIGRALAATTTREQVVAKLKETMETVQASLRVITTETLPPFLSAFREYIVDENGELKKDDLAVAVEAAQPKKTVKEEEKEGSDNSSANGAIGAAAVAATGNAPSSDDSDDDFVGPNATPAPTVVKNYGEDDDDDQANGNGNGNDADDDDDDIIVLD
ncbi:hypothetical protein PTSG_09697 [Salpingoeca rosetta]|uniref:Uncharacterized protein n=1 Tax=Salpingoeca rosetta (strain ATCC 50818 / BSB-021) TaxID=946362 RepID=F2UNS6_SALR5|nr:uncharacterized protein PTSG_09697 [Salpingoeca rosetta]EGD79281.1 hypothetical protein PTSG_09697 [Salpingoeca rosetta]|eukprot:XP_004989052.1 hypothetical protein PTSG_09697 [Salpingoeca rosetta]